MIQGALGQGSVLSNPNSKLHVGVWIAGCRVLRSKHRPLPAPQLLGQGRGSALEALVLQTDQHSSRRAATLAALRIVLALHALAVLAQAVLAGQFLSGIESPVLFHEWTAWFILVLSAIQIMLSLWLARIGGPLWLWVASIFIFIAEALQVGTGYGRFLGVHIPLGVFVFGAVVWMMLWSLRRQPAGGDRAV